MFSPKKILLLLASTFPLAAQIPAFPGAEGYGAYATGGRGGDVYYVTNLNSSGAGSLYNGLTTIPAAGRTIIFNVSGPIHLAGGVATRITSNKLTIAGQTAPGDGILLKDGTLRISADDIVIRHMRFRHGKYGSGGDCVDLDSNSINSILDHVSMSFSTDENFSSFGSPPENLTMQWSFNAWGLESHSAGGLWDQNHATCHHSVWAHNHTRNAKARPSGLLEWTNNVTFDWDIGLIMGDSQTPASWKANVIGNYFVCPPGNIISKPLIGASLDRNGYPNFSVWQANNLHDNNGDGILNGTDRGWNIVNGSAYNATTNPTGNYIALANAQAGSAILNIESPRAAYKKIVSNAGPLRMDGNYTGTLRDEVDTRLMQNLTTQTANHITRETDLAGVSGSGFGTFNSAAPPSDSDLDGMPNYWETALGWNAASDDHNTAFTAANIGASFFPTATLGYTYLEEYLHFKASPHALIAKNTTTDPTSLTVDLRRYTAGFTASPSFSITNISGGTITQYAANGTTISATGPIVKFIPTLNYSGRGKFTFTVTDSEGDSWAQNFCIIISTAALPKDLTWVGNNSTNNWDTTTSNWKKPNGQAATFAVGDNILIDETGSNSPAINLTTALAPGDVTVTGSKNYTLSGTGSIASSGVLTKASDSNLTISSAVSFASGTYLNGGEVIINNGASLGGGAIRFTGDSTLRSNYNSTTTHGFSSPWQVDTDTAASVYLPQKFSISGALSGAGTFNIYSPSTVASWDQCVMSSSGSGCTGTVNLLGTSGSKLGFVINGGSFSGFPSAKVNLSNISIQTRNNSGGNTFTLGSLSGDAGSTLSGSYYAGAATWSVGGNNSSTTFAGVISNGASGAATGFTKSGTGTLTLSGNSTHTGATTISGGKLLVTGSLGATAVSVASGAIFSCAGNIGSSLTLNGGSYVDVGVAPQTVGTLTVANGLTLASGCNLWYDLSSSPSGANDKISVTAGTLSQTGTINFILNLKDGSLGAGRYTLVADAPTSSASSVALTHNLPINTRQTFAMGRSSTGATTTKSIWLDVTGSAANLTWTGTSSLWDINVSTPWTAASTFLNLDNVIFDNTATNRLVTLSDALIPATITVNHTGTNYSFEGTGSIAGNAKLVKNNSGTLVIAGSTANTFSGGTIINAGTVSLANATALLGTGSITLNGGTLAISNTSTTLSNNFIINGSCGMTCGGNFYLGNTSNTFSGSGTVSLQGSSGLLSILANMATFSGTIDWGTSSSTVRLGSASVSYNDVNFGSTLTHFNLGTGSGTLNNRNANNTYYFGAISGGVNTHLNGRQTGSGDSSHSSYEVGHLNTSTTFSGNISHAGDIGGLDIAKVGTGTWTLAGTSDFNGSFEIRAGTLNITGSTECNGASNTTSTGTLAITGGTFGCETLTNEGTLNGYGTLNGDIIHQNIYQGRGYTSGTIGNLTINGTATLQAGSTLRMKGGTASDKIIVNGDLDLSSTVQIALTNGTTFGRFPLITYTGDLTSFSPTLTGIPAGTTAKISNSVAGSIDLVINDSDEDGLPDTWETTYFGNLNQNPTGDYDGDGTSNLAEYRLNLLPNNGTQFFKATGVKNANNFILSWPYAPGIVFTVQRSQTMNNDWTTLSTVTGAGTYTDPSPPAVKAFYRVQFTP